MKMTFKKNDFIKIDGEMFCVMNIAKRAFGGEENKVEYFTYELGSDDEIITHASLDDIGKDYFVFHLTKKVEPDIFENKIKVRENEFRIIKIDDGIYLDSSGEVQNVKEYKLEGNSPGIMPSELHLLNEDVKILYLNKKIDKKILKK